MTRIDDIDLVDVPDQWDEIVRRAAAGPIAELAPVRRERRRAVRAVAIAASVLVAAGAAALLFTRDDSTTQVATTDPSVDDTTSPTTAPDPIDASAVARPLLACTGGELLAGSIPTDAHADHQVVTVVQQGEVASTLNWSWQANDLDLQLVVPGRSWIDYVNDRVEPLTEPPGALVYETFASGEAERATAVVETGLPEPCARAEVIVAGGTEAERVAAATEAARSLSWRSIVPSPLPEHVVDEPSVRQWALGKASERLGSGVHLVEVSISEYRSDDRIGRMVGGLEGREPERAWSVILRSAPGALTLPGDPDQVGRDLLTMNFGAESKEWTMAAGVSGPADQAMRDREHPVPALVTGRLPG